MLLVTVFVFLMIFKIKEIKMGEKFISHDMENVYFSADFDGFFFIKDTTEVSLVLGIK